MKFYYHVVATRHWITMVYDRIYWYVIPSISGQKAFPFCPSLRASRGSTRSSPGLLLVSFSISDRGSTTFSATCLPESPLLKSFLAGLSLCHRKHIKGFHLS